MSAQDSVLAVQRPSVDLDIDRFLARPCEYFGNSLTRMMSLSRETLEELQLAALKRRFTQYRGALPMLDKLADAQNIDAIDKIEDVVPLLFGHAIYKSYPASLLDKHRYSDLTAWLNKLTTIDLSDVDVSGCRSIDDWLMTLWRDTPLSVVHTSGTSGTMSFLPWTRAEYKKMVGLYPVIQFQRFGHDAPIERFPLNVDCIYPFFRSGGLSHTVMNEIFVELFAGGEERFHAAYPERLSADMMLLAARYRSAAAKGQLDRLEIDPALTKRREEFEAQQRDMPRRLSEFFAAMQTKLAGKRIFIQATSNLLLTLSESGLKKGLRGVFAENSIIVTGGGGKGMVLPDDWQATVKKFFGVERINVNYGMSEMAAPFRCCEHGHYHVLPWVITFILDPDTGKPVPRRGRATGCFAFYDLLPDTRWGGFVSGDEVTMEWDACCPCGQSAPYLMGKIQRLSEKRSDVGEEKLSCASTPEAYAEALDFLNDGIAV